MPFDRIYRSGASRPPGSVGRTDELLVPITYQPPNPRTPDLGLIRTWIKICREKHTKLCSEPDLGLLASIIAIPSFRVIDCSRRSIVKPPATFEYAALSYVWGEPSGTTIDPPCPQPMIVLPEVLPRTIEGAINVAMELGFNYLWVDKYCIDQSTDQHALLMQLSSMDLIYKGAFVTIVAAAGNDAEFGLPGIGPRHRVGHPTVTINNRTWISGSREMQRSVLNSKWTTRGWTYQEAHFSRRLLTFTNEQVLFECN
ncbi:HET-domain-containing protein, partial [Ophiobolus disseminans]